MNRTGSIILILTLLFLAVILATQFSFGRLFEAMADMARDQMKAWIGSTARGAKSEGAIVSARR